MHHLRGIIFTEPYLWTCVWDYHRHAPLVSCRDLFVPLLNIHEICDVYITQQLFDLTFFCAI